MSIYLFFASSIILFLFNGEVRNYPLLLSWNGVLHIVINILRGQLKVSYSVYYFQKLKIKKHVSIYEWEDAAERECMCSVKKRTVSKNRFLWTKKYFWKGLLKFL